MLNSVLQENVWLDAIEALRSAQDDKVRDERLDTGTPPEQAASRFSFLVSDPLMIIGILSDTHSTLHPRLAALFHEAHVERILHAGDVGDGAVLDELARIAPTLAVRSNIDKEGSIAELPDEMLIEIEGISIYMRHIGGKPVQYFASLPSPLPAIAICGHSHIPLLEQYKGVLFLNPGAAGTRPRFKRPLTAMLLTVVEGRTEASIIAL